MTPMSQSIPLKPNKNNITPPINLSVPEVQMMSGHRDPRVLLNIYTKLDPQKLVEKLA